MFFTFTSHYQSINHTITGKLNSNIFKIINKKNTNTEANSC
ncbi:protein of unknown function [Maridesulfovibrio hydrothermalis AM13 = DSM 14728]|uniref:Uncharacterized protein n=1 Tax=Maridesulfovibrio hydrothermalis AM13 = DSM 14728 TaxID=1121451 RepID=L0R9S2_9BACT|nr:protein of unknown function [Maridesulfovibrio hydrothermalis AM13 = DSM 14728]